MACTFLLLLPCAGKDARGQFPVLLVLWRFEWWPIKMNVNEGRGKFMKVGIVSAN
jgi:hypothetical protein